MLIKAKKTDFQKTRVLAGFTQRSLGEQTNLSSPFLSQVENGTRNVSAPNAKNICEALGCQFEDIFEIVESITQIPAPQEEEHERTRKLFTLKRLSRPRSTS
ncbi:helix-turn-helix domain-containing protein [Tumebacillus flagellatus]|uniref:helix-turn-helix domain-containing protein n=1 Tax=Tumebacillus flagellatus TaxID=1157490 RepID=UPI0009E000A0|nr:helix-turn-helix transcriptional regulator [Tumebacillus flagellatus]